MTLDLVLGAVVGDLAQPPVKRGAVGQTTRGCLLSNDQENPPSGQHTVKPCRCGQRSPDRNARGAQRVRVRRGGVSPTRRTPSEGHDGGARFAGFPVERRSWSLPIGCGRRGACPGASASDGAIRARSRVPPAPDGAVRKLRRTWTRRRRLANASVSRRDLGDGWIAHSAGECGHSVNAETLGPKQWQSVGRGRRERQAHGPAITFLGWRTVFSAAPASP